MKRVVWSSLSADQQARVLTRPVAARGTEIHGRVAEVVRAVRERGDEAVRELGERFDRVRLESFAVTDAEWRAAAQAVSDEDRAALRLAAANIEAFHRRQLGEAIVVETMPGVRCERRPVPIGRVGLYAPGGTASLPSTVLMLGIPARLAGCEQRVLCTPPRADGSIDPYILAAAVECGITQVFKIGGAQAIAAMAYGTASVPKVDKIFGPGNAYVTEAKEQVARDGQGAALDMPAGPSEVLVVADETARAEFIAADLLSQAEHGPDSQVVLVATSAKILDAVENELPRQLAELPRAAIAIEALKESVLIEVDSVATALEVSNAYAPEHLILQVADTADARARVRNAGSVFVGAWSPESVGDYASGTNHVLPTYGHARAFSGCSVDSFRKLITFQELTPEGLRALGPAVERLAEIEQLRGHRQAVSRRLKAIGEER